jgi:hypothetical protein
MRKVTGTGTIAFELTYLTGTPTTSISTGDRWYTGEENDKPVLVHHTNGTPSNKCTTTIYTLDEVKEHFIWDWDNVPSFAPVKEWIEKAIKTCVCDYSDRSEMTKEQWEKADGHFNQAGGWCCPHYGNTCGHCHQYD